jgi:glycerol-3-phosphate acyltransferase PlsX
MENKNYVRIVVDTEGSDRGAPMMVKGVKEALDKFENLAVILVGNEQTLLRECEACGLVLSERAEILHASEVITNYDSPAEALFKKTDSSLVRSLEALAKREDTFGMLNAGSTGALIAGAMRYLPTPDRVRPALAAILPAESGGFTCLCDTGATIDCPATTLHHFARLGSEFMKSMYGVKTPRIGLLSNGAEPTKGNKAVKEAHALIAEDKELNFVGNIEGTKALSGECDVLVADGFAGNQVLKVTEGIATRIIKDIVKLAKKSGEEKYMQLVGYLMGIYDFNSLGGGIILGIRKPVIKAHGAATEASVVSTLKMLLTMAQNNSVYGENHG